MIPGNAVSLLHDGEQCLPAMLEAIEQAQREILLEMYWFGSDLTGRRFARALEDRARAGVRVYVSYDAAGSFEADRGMFASMENAGCRVYEFNPVHFWRPRFKFASLNQRNHRKMLIVDGRVGFTGGVNLADPWASEADGGLGFRDDMIRIEGPAVASMRDIFASTFPGFEAPSLLPAGGAEGGGDCRVRVLANDGKRNRGRIERAYLARIRRARERILITNSYFIPSRRVRRALADAVARGVCVRVLLPVDSDVPAVSYAMRRLYGGMLKRGIELYEWPESILHCKTAAIDGRWCTVGTHNLDYRSWAYNLEINVAVDDPSVAQELEGRILQDIARSVRVDRRNWMFRPLSQRVLEFFFFRFRRLM
jgi:cardiolipin synthase